MACHQFTKLIPFVLCLCVSCSQEEAIPENYSAVAAAIVLHDNAIRKARDTLSQLQLAVDNFLNAPSGHTIDELRHAWGEAHDAFIRARFLTSPGVDQAAIDLLDAWPIEEGFIDSLPEYPQSGIISDMTLDISPAVIRDQHQITDRSEVALGFHVIEYLVFARSVEDFVDSGNSIITRRRALLRIAMNALSDDLGPLTGSPLIDITEGPGADAAFTELLRIIGHSVGRLYAENAQLVENPHSRFSGQSRNNLTAQITILEDVIFEPVNVGSRLVELNSKLTRDVTHTVRELSQLLKSDQTNDVVVLRSSLLLAGLDHQLREFIARREAIH